MSANNRRNIIPVSVVRRFPKYYALLQRLRQDKIEWISSSELAHALSLTSSTVRQDLSHVDFSGMSKRGYSTEGMEKAIAKVLGADEECRVVIIGAGNLGRALALHGEFAKRGFKICGLFDADPKMIGRQEGGLRVQGMSELVSSVRKQNVDIGIIAVPAASAQEVADRLVLSNIRGLLNLAHVHLLVPPRVPVVDARILASLQELAYAIRVTPRPRHSV